mgnify:CR=1 FL=1
MYQYDKDGMGPGVYTSSRNSIKIGKLVNKILRTKYKDSDLEQFVNQVKSALEGKQEFLLISGKEIESAYDVNNYLNRNIISLLNNVDAVVFQSEISKKMYDTIIGKPVKNSN